MNKPVGFGEMGREAARRTAAAPPVGGFVSGSRFTRSKSDPAFAERETRERERLIIMQFIFFFLLSRNEANT